MKRIFIADPSLDDLRGHHYGLSITIADAAMDLGYQVVILANKRSTQALLGNPRYRFLPIFSASIYFVDGIKGQKECGDYFCREFRDFLDEEQINSGDIVLFHTAIGEVYGGLLRLIKSLNNHEVSSLPEIHLCTPYNEDLMPGNLRGQDLCGTISRISGQWAFRGRRIYFWVENYSLVNHYAVRTSVNHVPLHIPLHSRLSAAKVASYDLFKKPLVSYLGAAREEKGFLEVVALLRAYRNEVSKKVKPKYANARFFVHCVPQKVGYTKKIKEAIAELEVLAADLDIMLDCQSLSEERYCEILEESTALFLLYDERYRVRGSGILAEALTMGCRIMTTLGTVCARYADPEIDCVSSEKTVQVQYLDDLVHQTDEVQTRMLVKRTQLYRQLHDPVRYLRQIEARQHYEEVQGSFYSTMCLTVGVRQRMASVGLLDPLIASASLADR